MAAESDGMTKPSRLKSEPGVATVSQIARRIAELKEQRHC